MSAPSEKTVKKLFALSRNRCAFPQCDSPIVHESGAIIGDVCHIRAASRGGPRHDPGQTDVARHAFENLILLCKNHHQIVDAAPVTFTVDLLQDMKAIHERDGDIELSRKSAQMASRLYASMNVSVQSGRDSQVMVDSPGSVQAKHIGQVVFKTSRKKAPSITPEGGAIGHNLHMRNYALHLIERYNDFQKADTSKQGRGKYIVIYNAIKKQFGMKWDYVPQTRFLELVDYLQYRILNSRLGRIRNAHGEKCFSSWDEWLREQGPSQ